MKSKQPSLTKSAKKDFRVFLQIVWKHLELPKPSLLQLDIANTLQNPSYDFMMLQAFRGCGKSWESAVYVCWELWRSPQKKVLVVSATETRAKKFTGFVKRLIKEIPILQHLYPKKDQRSSDLLFDVAPSKAAQSASVTCCGIHGQFTGDRADIIIADDIEIPRNSFSNEMRKKTETAIEEFGAVMVPGVKIIFLGTPQIEDSLYVGLPDKGYTIFRYPLYYPSLSYLEKYPDTAPFIKDRVLEDPSKEGTSTFPERFTPEFITLQRLKYSASGYAMQFMLDTSLSDSERSPLKARDFITMSLNNEEAPIKILHSAAPQDRITTIHTATQRGDGFYAPAYVSDTYAPYTGALLTIDPSGRGEDDTTFCVSKMLHSKIFIHALSGISGTGYSQEALQFLADQAKLYNVNSVQIEDNFGNGMFTELFKPFLKETHPCFIEDGIQQFLQKEKRIIDSLEAPMTQHRIVLNQSIPDSEKNREMMYQAMYQLTRITREKGCLKHDDGVDVLSMAVRYWTLQLAQSHEDHIKNSKEEALQKELKRFHLSTSERIRDCRTHIPTKKPNFLGGRTITRY